MGFCQKQKFQYSDFIFISQLLNDMKYVLLEHWKNSDYFIPSVKASGWRAYCFQILLKMEHIRKGWGAHLVGDIFCAQPLLPVLSLSIVIVSLFNIYVWHK